MATLNYVEAISARTTIEAKDATYAVQFDVEFVTGKTWEFDAMSDAVGQTITRKTGFIKVRFTPVVGTMLFEEDSKRPMEYKLCVDDARILFKYLRKNNPSFWFALDMANRGRTRKLVDVLFAE